MKKDVIKDFIDKVFEIKKEENCSQIGIGHLICAAYELFPSAFEVQTNSEMESYFTFKRLKEYNKLRYSKVDKNEEFSPVINEILSILDIFVNTRPNASNEEKTNIILGLVIENDEANNYINSYFHYLITNELNEKPINKNSKRKNIQQNKTLKPQINSDEDFDALEEEVISNIQSNVKYNYRENLENLKGLYNVNERVASKNIHIIGRDKEVEEAFTTLSKKVKANVLLLGEAGVGKTAVVEKLAELINSGKVLENFKNTAIYELSVNELVAGTKYRGEFEDKIDKILKAVQKEQNVVLFIDEIHNAMGAGKGDDSSAGLMEILKPYLARSDIRVIGATTYDEYRKIFSKNKATDRRFEVINVSEPTKEETLGILKGIKKSYEDYHKIKITNENLNQIVDLSEKYISGKKFPDKAIDVLDYICARAKNDKIKITNELINKVIEKMANVKLESNLTAENFSKKVKSIIKGQDEAVQAVTDIVNLINLGIVDKQKPLASFLFTGPTGVGKTELAKQIAKIYFGSESKLIKIDMSDYPEKHDISKLIGASAGYVGYDEGSMLLNSVKKQPYSVVLLDEVEKAHPDVLNVFLQILDDGFLTDATGEKVDFRNTMIIMTSNLGSHQTDSKIILGLNSNETSKKIKELAIQKFFKPEFLNRIDKIIYFNKLNKDVVKEISEQYMSKFGNYTLTDEELEKVMELAEVDTYGARAIQKVVRSEILPDKIQKEKVSIN